MTPIEIAQLLRAGLVLMATVRNFTANASKEQMQAFVDAVHAQGGQVDLAVVDQVMADVAASGVAADKAIADAKAAGR